MNDNSSNTKKSTVPDIVYEPKEDIETQLVRFQHYVEERFNIKIDDYWSLYQWSKENISDFWDGVWHYFDIKSSTPYIKACSNENSFTNVKWFDGAKMNYTENIFKFQDSHIAIIATGTDDNVEFITYSDFYKEIHVYVEAMRSHNISKGDVIASYITNKKEAVFAYLATFAVGAIFCAQSPLLASTAVLSRLMQLKPKLLFTSGDFTYEGKEIRMNQNIPEIVAGLPSLVQVVYVPKKSNDLWEDVTAVPKCVTISEFLLEARRKLELQKDEIKFEQVDFNHPLTITFTSGTSGFPKGLVHNNGIIFSSLKDFGLHQNFSRNDKLLCFAQPGWVSWNYCVGILQLGATLCLYDGYLFGGSGFYDVIDKFGITVSLIWSSTVDEMNVKRNVPSSSHSLKTLKRILPGSSYLKSSSFDFITKEMKPGIFIAPIYGSTEFFGCISGSNCNYPVYKGEIQCFSLGVNIDVLNQDGVSVHGERGDLVLNKPIPNMTKEVFNDQDCKEYEEFYLKKYIGYWYVGDEVMINTITNGFIVYGRSDETLNPKGARFQCSEIYSALENFPNLQDSVCSSYYTSDGDEHVVLFVKLLPGLTLTGKIEQDLKTTIEKCLSFEHVPDLVLQVPDIPYNINDKKLNGLVKKIINKIHFGNEAVVKNPSSLEFYKKLKIEMK